MRDFDTLGHFQPESGASALPGSRCRGVRNPRLVCGARFQVTAAPAWGRMNRRSKQVMRGHDKRLVRRWRRQAMTLSLHQGR